MDLTPSQQATIVRIMRVLHAKQRKLEAERAQLVYCLQVSPENKSSLV